jgi:hypothetical protein
MIELYRPNQNAGHTNIRHTRRHECGHECPHACPHENKNTLHIILFPVVPLRGTVCAVLELQFYALISPVVTDKVCFCKITNKSTITVNL